MRNCKKQFKLESSVFLDIMCGPVRASRYFEETYRLHFQGRRMSQTGIQHEAGSNLGLLFGPEDRCDSSSETFVKFYRTVRRYISENKNSS
jgi:hypothetical protein